MRSLSIEEIKRLSPEEYARAPKHPFVVVLDNLRSRSNVGAVFRTMDAFAGEHLYLCGFTPLPDHREVHKTALGAEQVVPWSHHSNTSELLEYLKKEGYQIIAVEHTDQSISLTGCSFATQQKVAFVFGNEVQGISSEALQCCELALEIPQFGTKHSLNVSVSVGVVLWDFVRRMPAIFG
ncbi:MAG: RNA methyltransferase [Bernardetiaceae bacterium]